MSLRTVERELAANPVELSDELVGIHFNGSEITAIWQVSLQGGGTRRRSVVVSPSVASAILVRVAFGNILDQVRDDTHARAIDS
jgi:hypothetical protein